MRARVAGKEGNNVFFEKTRQKTFATCSVKPPQTLGSKSLFASFSSEKEDLT
jgi:hypothetical protein